MVLTSDFFSFQIVSRNSFLPVARLVVFKAELERKLSPVIFNMLRSEENFERKSDRDFFIYDFCKYTTFGILKLISYREKHLGARRCFSKYEFDHIVDSAIDRELNLVVTVEFFRSELISIEDVFQCILSGR